MKTRPKKAKKYSYTKDCKEQPREICDQCEKKTIQPVCEKQERLVCTYEPEETCGDEEKQYCHKVEKVELEDMLMFAAWVSVTRTQSFSNTAWAYARATVERVNGPKTRKITNTA